MSEGYAFGSPDTFNSGILTEIVPMLMVLVSFVELEGPTGGPLLHL